MALVAGDISCSSGLAKRIFDAWVASGVFDGTDQIPEPHRTAAIGKQKAMAFGVAKAVVDEIKANAKARITTSDEGLQRYSNGTTSVDTTAPTATKLIAIE